MPQNAIDSPRDYLHAQQPRYEENLTSREDARKPATYVTRAFATLLEVLNGENNSAEYQNRHSGNRNIKHCPFFWRGLFLLFFFQLFVKTFEHSWINLAGIILLTNPEWKGPNSMATVAHGPFEIPCVVPLLVAVRDRVCD
jgi:hypothetical protein